MGMSEVLPTALILGADHFVAKKLAEELVNKDIHVVGVGEMPMEITELKNFEWVMSLDEIKDEFDYLFDFSGKKEDWLKIKAKKFTLIAVDDEVRRSYLSREAAVLEVDWRIVEANGVYGERMNRETFLAKVIKQAVSNKNLELPRPEETIRLLSVTDLVEAILRACFLSGTAREYFLVLGKQISFEELARVLMDKAKMTRFKVMEIEKEINQGNEKLAQTTEQQLRWKAEGGFEEEIEPTLQYFFSLTDEENRKQQRNLVENKNKTQKKSETRKIFDVLVETMEVKDEEVAGDEIFEDKNETNELAVDESNKEPKLVVYKETSSTEEGSTVDFEIKSLIKKKGLGKRKKKKVIKKETGIIEEENDELENFDQVKNKEVLVSKTEDLRTDFSVKKETKKGWKKYWLGGFLLFLVVLLVEPMRWFWVTSATISDIKRVSEMVKDKKYNQVEALTEKRIKNLSEIDTRINSFGLDKLVLARNYQSGLKVLIDFLVLEKGIPEIAGAADHLNEAIFGEKQINWDADLNILTNGLMEVESNIGLLQARLSGDYGWLPAVWRSDLQKGLKTLAEIREKISLGREALKIIPDLLGTSGEEKDYMVLFQNESEIRPTGGFIGSYGIISFEGGRLKNFEIKDIYEADGQLKGHVEPPWEIKTHLNEANWYMRDANWKADFVKTAADIQWFLEKETNKKVDGVIGVDLAVAKSILKVTGEIYVPDFKEKIDENNLYEQAEFYAETKFFPGSVQKASFLGALGTQMFEEIKNFNSEKSLLMVDSILDLLERNELQIAVNNKQTAEKINNIGWDGSIYNGKCSKENCIADYWYLVEANLGVNKANYFVRRNMEEITEINSLNLNRTIKVNYENTAKNTNWPGGDYKNYARVYLPKEAVVSQISMSDGYDASIKKIYGSNEINIREVDGKKEVGFLVTVPVLKKRILEIKYSIDIDLSGKKEFTYMKYVQKQPGTGETDLVSLVAFPEDWQPLQVEPTASIVGGRLLFNLKLDKDIRMGVVLGK